MWYPDVPNPGGPPVIELSSIRFNNQPSHPFSHAGPFMQHHDFQPPNVSINSGISPGKEGSTLRPGKVGCVFPMVISSEFRTGQ